MQYSNKFEYVGTRLERLRVPGGWLVRTSKFVSLDDGGGCALSEALVFVPDVSGEWKV